MYQYGMGFVEQKTGYVQMCIWLLLHTGCNIFSWKFVYLHMKTMNEIVYLTIKALVLAPIAKCFMKLVHTWQLSKTA